MFAQTAGPVSGPALPGSPRRQAEHFTVHFGGRRAGVAVRRDQGFEFLSADSDFASLDGRIFSRARLLVNEIARHASRTRRHTRQQDFAPAPNDGGLW